MAFVLPAVAAIGSAIGSTAAAGSAAIGFTGASGAALSAGALSAATPAIAGATAASTLPGWLSGASLGLQALGGVTGALGAIQSANASASSAKYNAQVSQINAGQATQNANLAEQAGEANVAQQQRKTRAEVGSLVANQAASGLDVNTGSALDTRISESELGQLDALNVRTQAVKEAYGYQTQATSFENQSNLDTYAAKNDEEAGTMNAAGTVLGSAGSATNNYLRYLQAGGFSS